MAGLFYVKDRLNREFKMSDKELRDTIMEQSKESNYGWITSAKELMKVCNNPKFDKEYAKDIEVVIVNCFADLLNGDCSSDIVYAYDAYNKLFSIKDDEKVISIRKKFLKAYINRYIFYNKYLGNIHKTFWDARAKWVDNKISELLNIEYVDFKLLAYDLVEDFEKYIDEGINNGKIKEEKMKFKIIAPDSNDTKSEVVEFEKPDDETIIKIKEDILGEDVAGINDTQRQKGFIKRLKKKVKDNNLMEAF